MKRRIVWHFDLTLDYEPRAWRGLLILAMLVASVGDLASESVTLTTYYPAPSGVYAQMITTGNTYLARDYPTTGGKVGIGTAAPVYLLHEIYNGAPNWGALFQSGTASTYLSHGGGYGAYIDAGGPAGAGTYALNVNKGGAPYLYVRGDGRVGIGTAAPAQALEVNGSAQIDGNAVVSGNVSAQNVIAQGAGGNRGYLSIVNNNTACVASDVVQGAICGGGLYAAWQPGFNVQGWSYANRGGQVLIEAAAGQTGTQVWGINPATGNPQWMTLKKDDSVAHVYCCPL